MRVRGYAPATPCWSTLASTDPAGAATFYSGLFGWRTGDDPGFPLFELGDLAVAGLTPGAPTTAWLTYLSTEDIAASVDAVRGAGGSVVAPPTEAGARGRAAMVADTQGAAFGLWERGRGGFPGAQVGNEPNAVCWSELGSPDPDGAVAFYRSAFGWADRPGEIAEGQDYVEWLSSGRVVAGMVPMPGLPAHWRTTFEVDDAEGTAARCAELGGQAMFGPLDVGVGTYAYLADPYGGSFGVIALIPSLRGAY